MSSQREQVRAEAVRNYRRTCLCCLSDRKRMSNQLPELQERAEAVRNCCRTYLCCLPGRKNMSSLLQRELLRVLHRLRRSLSEADPEPAELHQDLLL